MVISGRPPRPRRRRSGFTWSDPAVGPLTPDRSTNAVIVGSGYFPDIEALIPARGSVKAGNALYLIDADTGSLIGNPSGSLCDDRQRVAARVPGAR